MRANTAAQVALRKQRSKSVVAQRRCASSIGKRRRALKRNEHDKTDPALMCFFAKQQSYCSWKTWTFASKSCRGSRVQGTLFLYSAAATHFKYRLAFLRAEQPHKAIRCASIKSSDQAAELRQATAFFCEEPFLELSNTCFSASIQPHNS